MASHGLKTLLVSLAAAATVSAAPVGTYTVTGSIAGTDGGWDYASIDRDARQLYVAHGDVVMAVDLANGNAVRTFGSIAKAHAVVPVTGKPLLLVTSAHDDTLRFLDTTDGHEVAKLAVGSDPDAAFYDPATGHAVIMNAKGGTVSVVDVGTRKIVRTIMLKPGLEFGVQAGASTLFVNNEDANEVETADLVTGKVGTPIKMPGCTGPTGLGYDPATRQLISACANGKAVVINATTKKIVRTLSIGGGPDAVIVDRARRLAIIPCGRDGTLSIIALDAAGGAQVAGTAKSEPGARTGALNPIDGALYLPTARFGAPAAGSSRPSAIPGSFHIVVMTRK